MSASPSGDPRCPAPANGAGGRHRKKRTAPRGHFIATAVAAGAVVAIGQPLLAAQSVPAAQEGGVRADVLRMAFTAPATTTAGTPAAGGAVVEAEKLQRAGDVRAAVAQRERVAVEKVAADQAAAEKAAADKVAAEKAAADKALADKAAADKAAAVKTAAPKAVAGKAVAPQSTNGFVKPAQGRFTSGFGGRWGSTHYGVDIANAIGTPIRSVAAGTVIEAGPASGFGLWVRVQHDDGTVTVYGHVNTILAAKGKRVAAGEQIATMGNRGQSTGPHLHFEVWQAGGRKIDPLPWLRARGITL
ncbi:M23 family metallopeptidase [Actinokineospora sp. NBRC 105648]|uniref:M23 family metallopeptidase n=1 Tax=Actinokineospora sp. NBRC 105648 TaxID=3032206 RepID=UPI0024A25C60|nr:M23 family metallopeptidase [Actinokineospora sp. NBRC 105648]GLZ38702.1 hypothetical protein Acsp05_23260 [Actinokineospora sp. NBRC 105648]